MMGVFSFVFADELESLSPFKQQKIGIDQKDVECNEGMFLAFKVNGEKSSCVYPYTLDKLISRGWALPHQEVNFWYLSPKMIEKNNAYCKLGEKVGGGYYKTQNSTLEFQWIKEINDKDGNQGIQVQLFNPEEYKQYAYVYVDCFVSPVDNFESCVDASNIIIDSYPRQCKTNDGMIFIEKIPNLEVEIKGEKQIRRGAIQTLEINVMRGNIPIEGAQVFIDIEDYGENILKEFDGRTDTHGKFVFSWEIPKKFEDIETLLAFVDVTDNISSTTKLFKFIVYCLPGEKNCNVDGN